MKKIIPYLLSLLCCSFTIKTSIRALTVVGIVNEAKAQFGFYYTPPDSIWHNQGGWSLNDLYQQKDSTANPYSSFWRFTSKIVEARSLSKEFPNRAHDTLACLNPDGRFFKRSVSSLTLSNTQIPNMPAQFSPIQGAGMSITGTYPNVTFASTAASQTFQPVNLTIIGYSISAGTNTVALPNPTLSLGGVPLLSEVDGSTTNELQTISGSGTQTLSLNLGGGNFVIPTQTTGIISNITPTITGLTGISMAAAGESYSITNTIPDKTVTIIGGTGIAVTSAYPAFTINPTARTANTVSRSLVNSTSTAGFSISGTQDYNVVYSVFAQAASALAGTNTAEVYLELCLTSGGTYTTIAGGPVVSVSGVLSTNGGVICLAGFIPAGYFLRIRTAATGANSGSAVFTYKYGNENSY